MSRPPHPLRRESTGRGRTADVKQLDYLPLQYADLLELQEQLAVTRLGRPLETARDPGAGDFARTFMELSALVGHVLSAYQRHYAREAFLGTAQSPGSLVRHAHRLAYDPDPGLAASGYAVLFTKELVGGTVAAGLPLASVPLGEIKAQDYETREDLAVDAALNELVPMEALEPVTVAASARELCVQATGLGLATGDFVALLASDWRGYTVEEAVEDAADGTTTVRLQDEVGVALDLASGAPPVLLAQPSLALRPFGVDADPSLFPADEVRKAGPPAPPPASEPEKKTSPKEEFERFEKERLEKERRMKAPLAPPTYWYEVSGGPGYREQDVYLSQQQAESLVGRPVLRWAGGDLAVLEVVEQADVGVALVREAEEAFETATVSVTRNGDDFSTQLTPVTAKHVVRSRVSGNVTAIAAVRTEGGTPVPRKEHPFPAQWLTDWRVEVPLAARRRSSAGLGASLDLPGLLAALSPGRPLVFTDLAETRAQVVTVRAAELRPRDGPGGADVTRIWWDPVTPTPATPWVLGDLKVYGNVARVSHGRTVAETLGGSDGVTPFQRFALAESPLTVLSGAAGGEPELEVRVNDVLWSRVQDFAASGPDDRHYRSVADADGATSVLFGDGRNGAVPPSGKKNVTAVYRVGLGRVGDVETGRLSRLKRAHPLLDRVVNVTAVHGGAEPADAAAIRSQATRWIRTFDRAVSVSDLADLALTMPGIARAASRWDQSRGSVLVVATAAGETPPALDAVRAFLDARRDVNAPLELRGPEPRAVRLEVDVEPDPSYLEEVVKNAVRAALHGEDAAAPGMFTFAARELGQPAFLSEVYERLEAVPGVVGVRVTRFEADGTPALADVVPAGIEQWLRLAPNDLTVTTRTIASAAA